MQQIAVLCLVHDACAELALQKLTHAACLWREITPGVEGRESQTLMSRVACMARRSAGGSAMLMEPPPGEFMDLAGGAGGGSGGGGTSDY